MYRFINQLTRIYDQLLFKLNKKTYWNIKPQNKIHPSYDLPKYFEGAVKIYNVINNNLHPGTTLEIGAGKRFWTYFLEKKSEFVYATDLTWENDCYDVTKIPLPFKFANVVAIGVLHHILEDDDFKRALWNINEMAMNTVILGVKIDRPKIPIAKNRPLQNYIDVFGEPIIEEFAGYLTVLVFNKV